MNSEIVVRVRSGLRLLVPAAMWLSCLIAPSTALAQALSPERAARFDRGDRESRALLDNLRCAQGVANLRAAGAFGPVDSLGRSGQCVVIDGKRIGIFLDADSLFSRVTRFSAVDFATRSRRTAPLDTMAILAVAKAELAAQLEGMKAYEDAKRQYAPFAFRFDGDSIEVWMIPEAVLRGQPLMVGGERGYVFTPDGRAIVRRIDDFAALRTIAAPDTGAISFVSQGHDVPTLTEFLLTNALNEQGRTVIITTPWGQSMLVGKGAGARWLQLTR
jgi:hypothetical protein